MKVLFLCGVFADENLDEIIEKSIGPIEHSANLFQKKLINGFLNIKEDITVISAPFIGAYPMRSKILFFNKFRNSQDKYIYCPFFNLWGFRNFSRAKAMKIRIRDYMKNMGDAEVLIVVYSAHQPFLEAAVWAKKKYSNIKVCFIVPDLPQYMNLDKNRSIVYDFFKKIDIYRINKLQNNVDSFVILTEYMKEHLMIQSRPYIIVEGIIDRIPNFEDSILNRIGERKKIVYTGKLNEQFGIPDMITAFRMIKNDNLQLVLCGAGDCEKLIVEASKEDDRIVFLGQVTPREAMMLQKEADVLINPRNGAGEYTKYSFPSKIIEYLMSGNPVVCYKLSGMPNIYDDLLYFATDESVESLSAAINKALAENAEKRQYIQQLTYEYFMSHLYNESICKKIIEIMRGK